MTTPDVPSETALRDQARLLLKKYMDAADQILESGGRLSTAHASMTKTLASMALAPPSKDSEALADKKKLEEMSIAELEALLASETESAEAH
jgi:hypothetical protein